MIVLIRTLAIHQKPWFSEEMERRWGTFVFLSCLVEPALEGHERVSQIMGERRRKEKKATYKELAYSVLARAGKPMRWTEIAEEACVLGRCDSLETKSFFNALQNHKELFVRMGQGTYELSEWGHQPVENYQAIVASILRQANIPLPYELIFARVSAIRPVTSSTLAMCLDMHYRFYKSIQNTYGLRAWLASGEQQSLRTPEWFMEASKSLARVERARAKGLHVDRFIHEDRLQ
jgi:hypothetical protein